MFDGQNGTVAILEMILQCHIQIKRVPTICESHSDRSDLTVFFVFDFDDKVARGIGHTFDCTACNWSNRLEIKSKS